jgi:ABC-type bacteriocin/lantibiotic exporter with double-glycine peptidase domain
MSTLTFTLFTTLLGIILSTSAQAVQAPVALGLLPVVSIEEAPKVVLTVTVPSVPFYSQFEDIVSTKWQKVGCGVTSLAMVIDYYKLKTVSVDTLLNQGVAAGAYLNSAGWTYKGLISLGNKYGLDGDSYDLGKLSSTNAFTQFEKYLKDGPVIASVHYKFDPQSTIPHLVVINGIDNNLIYYNDPAAKTGGKTITVADFLKGWKKRFIVIRPQEKNSEVFSLINKTDFNVF